MSVAQFDLIVGWVDGSTGQICTVKMQSRADLRSVAHICFADIKFLYLELLVNIVLRVCIILLFVFCLHNVLAHLPSVTVTATR